MIGESGDGRPESGRGGVDPSLSASVGETGVLVETEGQVLAEEEFLEGPSQRPSGASWAAGPFQHGLGVAGFAVGGEAADGADHHTGSGDAVTFGGELSEADQPRRRSVQSGHEVLGLGDRSGRAAGPATQAHAFTLLAGQGAALRRTAAAATVATAGGNRTRTSRCRRG